MWDPVVLNFWFYVVDGSVLSLREVLDLKTLKPTLLADGTSKAL